MSDSLTPDPTAPRGSIGARRNPETETAVLDAAAALIAEEGFAKLTIEAVARRARAGKATIYRWWPSRGHLLLALYSRAKGSLPCPDSGTLRGDLTLYLAAMLRQWHGVDGPPLAPLLRLLIAEAQMDDTVQAAMLAERQSRWHHIDDMLARARARGEVNPALSPGHAEQRIIALLWYRLLTGTLPAPEAAPDLVADLLQAI